MKTLLLRAIFLLTLAGMVGCASVSPRSDDAVESGAVGHVAFDSSSVLALTGEPDDGLLHSQVEAASAEERLSYTASYSLQSSVLAQSQLGEEDSEPVLPAELGRQSLRQQLHLALPSSLGAPVSIDIHNQQDLRWTFNGEARAETRLAHLQWKPKLLALDLRWTPPRDVVMDAQPLDCQVQANLRLPKLPVPTHTEAALDLSGRGCQVRAPARGVDGLHLQSHGLAWRWGEDLNNRVRVRRVVPQWQAYGLSEVNPAYEVGLMHRRSLSGWQLGLDMAWRQFDQGTTRETYATPSNWAVDLMLRRELGLVALSARWLHASDPLWFLPLASPVERERLSLLLDFSQWLVEKLPQIEANMSASWDHVEDARGIDDNQFKWNLLLSW